MSNAIVARRYALALLESIAAAGADAKAVLAALAPWGEWLGSDDASARALTSPVITPGDRAAVVDKLLAAEGADKLVQGFVKVVMAKGRLGIVADILTEAAAELDRRSGTVQGTGRAAFALDDALKQKITSYLAEELGRTPNLTWHEDPELIGGFVVQIGHRIWDASLHAQLGRLGENIRKGVR